MTGGSTVVDIINAVFAGVVLLIGTLAGIQLRTLRKIHKAVNTNHQLAIDDVRRLQENVVRLTEELATALERMREDG
jgi:N-glycosylase/DNA lyase